MPDYEPRRWVLLVLADKVDVIEHNPLRTTLLVGVLALGALGLRALARR